MNIYFERKPDHYVGDDVSITIHYNTRGEGMAEDIADRIREYIKTPVLGSVGQPMKTESEKALERIAPDQARMLYGVLLGNDASTIDPEMQYTPLRLNLALDYLRVVLLERMNE